MTSDTPQIPAALVRVLTALVAALPVGCSRNAAHVEAPRTVTLLAAASTTEAVEELAGLFEKQTGAQVEISTGATNALARQLLTGAPGDLFLSAARRWADEVRDHGLAAKTRTLLHNRLVLVVPRGNPAGIEQPADLLSKSVQRVALAGENVPAGRYADQALRSLGLADELAQAGRVVRGHDVRGTLRYVERAEVEAAIVYATDARVSGRVETVYEFDPATHDPLVYPLVLVQREEANPLAREFFDFLASDQAVAVFRRHGFRPATESTSTAPDQKRG